LTDQDGKHAALVGEQTKARAELTRIGAALEGLRMSVATGGRPLARLVEEQGEGGQLPGWVGRLAARMRVKQEHRAAVESALGVFAEGLVFRAEEDLQHALAWLEAQEGWGEVGIVGQGMSPATMTITVPPDPSFIGLGSDLVETSPEDRGLVDRLLSRTLLVRDRAGAARLVRWLPAGAQAVTLAGEVYLPGGAVVVRRERGAGPDPSFEARLEAARANQWKKVEQYEREVSTGLRELEEMRREVEETEGALSNARSEEVEGRLSRERHALTLQAAEEHHARVLHEIRALEEESANLAPQQVDLEAAEVRSGEEQRLWEAELSAARALLEGETPGVEGEAPALLRLRRQVDEGRQRLEEMRGQEARLTDSGRQRRGRLEATRATLLETDQEGALHQTSLAQLEGRLGILEADLRTSGERLEELEGTRSTLESDAARARTELQAAERLGSHAQIELAKREQELASLSRRIQDDFGLVAFDFDESQTVQVPLPIEGLVERLQRVEELPLEVESQVERLRAQLRRTGPISPEVQMEYEETRERFEFLTQQLSDLEAAETQIQEVVTELDDLMEREFSRTFEAVSAGFKQAFARLFGGGSARLSLVPSEDGTSSGIEIEARLPGRREQGLSMLSGGERSLTACALIFAMLNASPTPFCVLDEVDAMLDDANVVRFCEMLRELSRETQVVVITHNRQTIQSADVIYGVSMGSDSASRIVSLKLDEAERQLSR
jgi:chromosome segregation protein